MTHAITVKLSDNLYTQLRRAAELARQPIEIIVEQSLAHSLPPLLEDIPLEYQENVYPLLRMNHAELQGETKRIFPAGRWAEYEALLNKKKSRPLTAAEHARLDALRHEANALTFRKGYAAVLLKRCGYRLPSLAQLQPSL